MGPVWSPAMLDTSLQIFPSPYNGSQQSVLGPNLREARDFCPMLSEVDDNGYMIHSQHYGMNIQVRITK